MKAWIDIRRNSDGIVRRLPELIDFGEVERYLWSEGNFKCDCNRAIFFFNCDDYQCGDTAFSVRITAVDNTLLYADGKDWLNAGEMS